MRIMVLDDSEERHKAFAEAYPGCVQVRTAPEAIAVLGGGGSWSHVFLDHDLGEGDGTGQDVTRWMAEHAPPAATIWIHSMNPYGARAMESDLRGAGYRDVRIAPFGLLRLSERGRRQA